MSWGSIPEELLALIFQRVTDFSDLYQCLAICTSWRFAAREFWRSSALATTPWLLIKSHYSDNKLSFITRVPSKSSNMISIRLPTYYDDHFNTPLMMVYSSYQGWLLLVSNKITSVSKSDYHSNMYLYNPMTRVLLHIPVPLPSPLMGHSQIRKFITSSSPTDPNCIICVMAGDGESYRLSFCKPGDKTYKGWNTLWKTHLELTLLSFEDMIFYRDQFYTIYNDDLFFLNSDSIVNSSTSTSNTSFIWPRMKLKRKKVAEAATGPLNHNLHLVESKIGELLMVERVVQQQSRRSVSFHVFKLNWSNKEWEEVSGFGGDGHQAQALFLARTDSTFVSVEDKENEEYKPNCIYFFDESCNGGIVSFGVYDLRNHTIERFNPSSQITYVEDTIAEWFRPSAL